MQLSGFATLGKVKGCSDPAGDYKCRAGINKKSLLGYSKLFLYIAFSTKLISSSA